MYQGAGKGLSGGSMVNRGFWTRGDALDYDEWARDVGDDRWSYGGLLPYFRRSESHFDTKGDTGQHGFDGPITTTSVAASGRKYPLRDHTLKLWSNLPGLKVNDDANGGHPQGISDLVENWKDGKRQITSSAYPLEGVEVLANTLVRRVIFEDKIAVGVECENGEIRRVKSNGQVVISAGAYRTPQVLL